MVVVLLLASAAGAVMVPASGTPVPGAPAVVLCHLVLVAVVTASGVGRVSARICSVCRGVQLVTIARHVDGLKIESQNYLLLVCVCARGCNSGCACDVMCFKMFMFHLKFGIELILSLIHI